MAIKRICAAILAFSMVFCFYGCKKSEKLNGGDKDIEIASAVWSDSTVVTEDMYAYFFNAYYRYFVEEYSASLSGLGLDITQPLHYQKQSEEYTWQQYMVLQVYRQLREMIALADAAKEDGMKIEEDDNTAIENQIAVYDAQATQESMEVGAYIEKMYGEGVTKDTIRKCLEIRTLANKYYNKLWNGYEFSEDDCLKYYEENRNSFVHFDCIKITVSPTDAETLKKSKTEKEFVDNIRDIITTNSFFGEYDRFADTIENQIKKKYYYRMDYNDTVALSKWAVENNRKAYDVHTKTESSGNITVSMILPTDAPGAINEVIYRDDVPLKNIIFMAFEDGEGTDGKTKADSIYRNWSENPTVERFEELAAKYDGGTVNDIISTTFDDEAIREWVFAKGRKAEDVEIVEADGGAYLIYMLEDGEPVWMSEVRSILKENKYAEDVNAIMEKHPTEYNEDVVYTISEVRIAEPETETVEVTTATEDTTAAK